MNYFLITIVQYCDLKRDTTKIEYSPRISSCLSHWLFEVVIAASQNELQLIVSILLVYNEDYINC